MLGRFLSELNEMIKLAQLGWPNARAHILQCISTIRDGGHDLIGMTDGGIGDGLVLQLHRVRKTLTACILDITPVGAVVFGGG